MLTFTIIFLLLILAGWFDSRLDWGQSETPNKENPS